MGDGKHGVVDLEEIRERIKEVCDPEIGINLVDLGLIYGLQELEPGTVQVEMTMTTPGCPAHDNLSQAVKWAVAQATHVYMVYVDVVWDPPWSPERMSDAAKRQLGW
ncbi:metal-sulfur cluster assembly factor [Sulfoacidibacillus ferrooxidans]|uniref:Fe-S protein maturation auxiliary factor SufT n=1 Tax=Sulfoacidibacillus ferrooxidans TaxID=2005001 RepID=A0A9X1VAN8_9BACL|nr:iron-sulfur cluster assembly protein [Sulfoacidibacillus ferrooxidans]MCI0184488.1 Fe-S protein maturation auxiliary factor SufT [Sulfoacidibacillus ferrooxidans]